MILATSYFTSLPFYVLVCCPLFVLPVKCWRLLAACPSTSSTSTHCSYSCQLHILNCESCVFLTCLHDLSGSFILPFNFSVSVLIVFFHVLFPPWSFSAGSPLMMFMYPSLALVFLCSIDVRAIFSDYSSKVLLHLYHDPIIFSIY